MAEAVFQCFFSGYSTTFRQNRQPFSGKPGDPAGTNTAGKNDLLRGRIRWNGTVGIRRGIANKKQKLPYKKRTAPFPERYTIRSGKWERFTFPGHSLSGPCCSTHSHAADKKEKLPSIPLWSCPIWTKPNSGIF